MFQSKRHTAVCHLTGMVAMRFASCLQNPLSVIYQWLFISLAVFVAESTGAQGLSRSNARFLGVQSCSSSSCHGGAKTNFDQVLVWTRRDFHTRSYATLTTARSARLSESLQITNAIQSTRCTSCHAPFYEIHSAPIAGPVQAIDGVSCESCHGPAEPWIRTHTRLDLTHEEKVAAGMRDLRNFYIRANTCVACHQNVEPELLKAGHPELIFELDGQTVTEPRHWRERRDDYGPALWLTGQAVALREMSWALAQQKEPLEREIERWAALRWLLTGFGLQATASGEQILRGNFTETQRLADRLAREAANSTWSVERTSKELTRLAGVYPGFRDTKIPKPIQARRAERLVLALDRLLTALPVANPTANANKELDDLFRSVQSLPDFEPSVFAERLAEFERRIR